jgi:chaperone BCS1
MLLRSEDVDVALWGLKGFLQERRRKTRTETEDRKEAAQDKAQVAEEVGLVSSSA